MYNRYIPQPDGSYRRSRMQDHEEARPTPRPTVEHEKEICEEQPAPKHEQKKEKNPERRQEHHRPPPAMPAGSFLRQLLPKDLDTGDLIVILLLLLMAGDCREDQNTAMLTLALYLFM